MPSIIFHHPKPILPDAKSASGIRPARMLEAFASLGFEVDVVAGFSGERKKAIARVLEKIKGGEKYDFLYSEASTLPLFLTDTHHLPLRPLMDARLFMSCRRHGIPVGVFYRDVYWNFATYKDMIRPFPAWPARMCYLLELQIYRHCATKVFLPSREMADFVPLIDHNRFSVLPPAHDVETPLSSMKQRPKKDSLHLFYVGGILAHYRMDKLFMAVRDIPSVRLTLCLREKEWKIARHSLAHIPPNVEIVHLWGDAMRESLLDADVALLFIEPDQYRTFAVPFKLFEYIGFRKPVIASEGTLAGRFVRENGIGWAVPYEEHSLRSLLLEMINDPSMLETARSNLDKIAPVHSWKARARQVVRELGATTPDHPVEIPHEGNSS